MKLKTSLKAMTLSAAVVLLGITVAFAQGGWRGHARGPMMGSTSGYAGHHYGPHYGPHNGPMMGPGYGGQRGSGRFGLTAEDAAKVEPLREKFLQDTESLRLKLDEKRFDLNQEMSKAEPDPQKAAQLQKELSDLRAEFGQKALEHRLEVRALLPDKTFGPGTSRGSQRGPGHGFGGRFSY